MKKKTKIIISWFDIRKNEPISIYSGEEGFNPFAINEIWRELKPSIIKIIWEGDFLKLIHNVVLHNKDVEETYDYMEIEIPTPSICEGFDEVKTLSWYNETLLTIVTKLIKLGYTNIELAGPTSFSSFISKLKKFLMEKK